MPTNHVLPECVRITGPRALPPCVTLLILAHLEMLPLLRCRLVSRRLKELADSELRVDMRRIVGHYLPAPDQFLDDLVSYSAVVSSQAALALFLRDRSILDRDLEVSVKYGTEEAFNEYVRTSLPVVKVHGRDGRGLSEMTTEGRPQRHTTVYKIKGASRRYIRVIGCSYPTPLGAISSLRNTALLCFFSPILMGCAYPFLTLRRLGLHRDTNLALGTVQSSRTELIKNIKLITQGGFRFSWEPRDFIFPRPTAVCEHGVDCPHCSPYLPCVRQLYVCGCNLRYWGDRGCLMAVLDPSSSWRELLVVPDPEGQIFTPWDWNWLDRCGPRLRYPRDPLEMELNDWNCAEGERRIAKLSLHLAPSFAGEEALY
ncbi:hypothetical protein C8T65DRAFT_743452 [Cerioporus squamosus]|nr:hypothetical protein C8T65DRAFT_743452 [Cerioporus squamosus]